MRLRVDVAVIVVAGSAALLLAACGSSGTAPTTTAAATTTTSAGGSTTTTTSAAASTTTAVGTGNFSSCSVVTPAEAKGAIGQTVTSGVLGTATVEGGLACVFYGPSAPTPRDPNVAQTDSVRVVVVKGPKALTWYNDYKSKVSTSARPISGYGDQAFYDGFASLSVLKGDFYLRIAVSPAGSPPSLSDEERLATAILPKL